MDGSRTTDSTVKDKDAMNQMLPIVKTFTEYLLDERHFSQYTSRCYGADLRQYVEYLEETLGEAATETAEALAFEQGNPGTDTVTGLILGADTDRIRAFLATLAEQEYSPATMAIFLAMVAGEYSCSARVAKKARMRSVSAPKIRPVTVSLPGLP